MPPTTAIPEARLAVLENDVKWIRETLDKMAKTVERLDQAGLPRRVDEAEAVAKAAATTAGEARDAVECIRSEQRGAWKLVTIIATIVGLLAGFFGWIANSLHIFGGQR